MIGVAAVAVVAATAAVAWFQPQKLLIDERVDEALPAAVAPGVAHRTQARAGRPPQRPTPSRRSSRPAPSVLLATPPPAGAVALALADGRRFLRLDDLRTSNGPDLFVYLSAAAADAPRATFDDDFVNLGRLRANQGNQNYEIPDGVAL